MEKNIYKIHVRESGDVKYVYTRAESIELALQYAKEEYPQGEVELVMLERGSTIL